MLVVEPLENLATSSAAQKLGLRERQRLDRDEKILKATFDLLAERGYEALTMELLAERVGISRQTLYHHFSSKADITLRALLKLMEEGINTIEAIDPNLSPVIRLEKVLRWMLDLRFQPAPAAFVKVKPALAPIKTHPDYLRGFERRAQAIARIVDEAKAAGQVHTAIPSSIIVQMLLSAACDGRYEDVMDAEGISSAELIECVVRVFFSGISPLDDQRKN